MKVPCDVCLLFLPNGTAYEVHLSTKIHRDAVVRSSRRANYNNPSCQDEKPVPCDACGLFLHNTAAYEVHRSSRGHRAAIANPSPGVGGRSPSFQQGAGSAICGVCGIFLDSAAAYEVHQSSRDHQDTLARLVRDGAMPQDHNPSSSGHCLCSVCNERLSKDGSKPHTRNNPNKGKSRSIPAVGKDTQSDKNGITVSDKDGGVDFGTMDLESLYNVPAISRKVMIQNVEGGSRIALSDVRVSSRMPKNGMESSFIASVIGQTRWINPGPSRFVEVTFKPTHEGRHIAVLELVFHDVSGKRLFVISRNLQALVGLKDGHQNPLHSAPGAVPTSPSTAAKSRRSSASRPAARSPTTRSTNEQRKTDEIRLVRAHIQNNISPPLEAFLVVLTDGLPDGDSSGGEEYFKKEHKRLDELLDQSLLRLDGISLEEEWQEARKDRKAAVVEAQRLMEKLEAAQEMMTRSHESETSDHETDAESQRPDQPENESFQEEDNIIAQIRSELTTVQDTLVPTLSAFLISVSTARQSMPQINGCSSQGVQEDLDKEHAHLDELLIQALLRLDGMSLKKGWRDARRERKLAVEEVQDLADLLEVTWHTRD